LARTAAARLLVARGLRSERLGWHVVKDLKATYSVWISDGGVMEATEAEPGGPMVKYLLTKTKPGYPPLVRIDLTTSQNAEQMIEMVVPGRVGRTPIYLTRKEKAAYRPIDMEFGRMSEMPYLFERLNLVKQMSGIKIDSYTFREVGWKDAKTFLDNYTKERDEIRRRLDRAVSQMRKKGWLGTNAAADFRIPLREEIEDQRTDTSVSLPEIPPAPELDK